MKIKPEDFHLITPEWMEEYIISELKLDMEIGYTARYHLWPKFTELKLNGHLQHFERIGEIINEFEHWIEYTYPDRHVGRFFYQDLIDNAMWYCERERRACPAVFNYPDDVGYAFKIPTGDRFLTIKS